MGEDVNNYEEIIFDDDEDDDYEENEDDYETEDQENDCHHTLNHDGDVMVEHRLECGARVIHCCEKHHHVYQVASELKQPTHLGDIYNDPRVSREINVNKTKNSNYVSENGGTSMANGKHSNIPNERQSCLASSNSSSSDQFLELPFNDLSVTSGIYGAARNACYTNANITYMPSSSMNRKR